jgi:hypothetical protein
MRLRLVEPTRDVSIDTPAGQYVFLLQFLAGRLTNVVVHADAIVGKAMPHMEAAELLGRLADFASGMRQREAGSHEAAIDKVRRLLPPKTS